MKTSLYYFGVIVDVLTLAIIITTTGLVFEEIMNGEFSTGKEMYCLACLYVFLVAVEKIHTRRFGPDVSHVLVEPEDTSEEHEKIVLEITKILKQDVKDQTRPSDWLLRANLNLGGARPQDLINKKRAHKVLALLKAENDGY